MFKKLMPHTTDFYKFFEDHCALIEQATKELITLTENSNVQAPIVARIKELEHEADTLTHRCFMALQKTFITPFERGHIHAMIGRLDDVMDSVNDAASRIALYELKEIRPEAKALAQTIHEAVQLLGDLLRHLRNLKEGKAIRDISIKINRLENDGDELLRSALRNLFSKDVHPYQVIQWKEIFEHLEKATDRCEDVADIVQEVVLEAS